MVTGRHLVLVDGIPETEQVVRAVFEPQGNRVTRMLPSEGVACDEPSSADAVDLVIIDQDGLPTQDAAPPDDWDDSYRVVIGSARYPVQDADGQQYLRKPFQYAELIGAIEKLLSAPSVDDAG